MPVCVAREKHEDALPLLKSSLEILQRNLGPEYPAAAEARFYLALVHASNPLLEAERSEIYDQLEQVGPGILCMQL